MTLNKFSLSLVAVSLIQATLISAATLASWDNWADNTNEYAADATFTGFDGSISVSGTGGSIHGAFGSDDGTFGDDLAGAGTATNSLLLSESNNNSTVTITLTNNSGSDYSIGSFHFDFAPRQNGNESDHGYDAFTLTYTSGGLAPDSTEIDDQSNLGLVIFDGTVNAHSSYPGYDYSLSNSLSDILLGNGESAIFTMVFSGYTTTSGEGANTSSVLDNVAFQGSVIPEPSSIILLLSSLVGFTIFRRKR